VIEFWVDTAGLIEASNRGYAFDLVPGFWPFLVEQAKAGRIACPITVYTELTDETYGPLRDWAVTHRDTPLFVNPNEAVQRTCTVVGDHVRGKYEPFYYAPFLAGADPWLIAHVKTDGGVIVTNEILKGLKAKKVKIPNVCDELGLPPPIELYEMARRLGFKR